jgi:hypothetical protein
MSYFPPCKSAARLSAVMPLHLDLFGNRIFFNSPSRAS